MNFKEINIIVEDMRRKIYARPDMSGSDAVTYLNAFSALIGTVRELYLESEMEYNTLLHDKMSTEKTVTQAKSASKTTDVYRQLRERENLIETILDLISSLKYNIKIAEREYKEAKY